MPAEAKKTTKPAETAKSGKGRDKKIKIRPGRLARKEALMGYLFVSPWLIGVLAFLLVPLVQSFRFIWYNIRITPLGMKYTWVGTGNFTQIWLEDPEFPQQLVTYVWQTIVEVPVIVVFALMIAMMLNQNIKFRGLFRLIFFLPVIIVSGPVMNMLVSEGAATIPSMNVQAVVAAFDRVFPYSIAQQIGDMFSNMIMVLWYSGVQILIFLSSLQKMDVNIYEAAKIDGACGWECFWKLTLPSLKPMILINSIYTVIFLSGNEQNELINIIENSMFSGTKEKGYGYASAMAWMYAIVITLIALLFFLILGTRKDEYERNIKKYKKKLKKEARERKRILRRNERYGRKLEKQVASGRIKTYGEDPDYK
ncbi:MAG: sugar ABC transporter permease [Lachnospiraceae bacterium]|nr:sugar ABC transporter permease [Lachnospiraceae bacterium]